MGGIIGTFAGGMAGGITGAKISVKWYERMEAKLQAKKELALSEAAIAKYLAALEEIDASPDEPWEQV